MTAWSPGKEHPSAGPNSARRDNRFPVDNVSHNANNRAAKCFSAADRGGSGGGAGSRQSGCAQTAAVARALSNVAFGAALSAG